MVTCVGSVAAAVGVGEGKGTWKCESVAQLGVELGGMLNDNDKRFVLVFDGVDRQREGGHMLLPGLGRLSEIIPSLTTVFVVTSPQAGFLRCAAAPHVHFPAYTKQEVVSILGRDVPTEKVGRATDEETAELWTRFVGYVHDALGRAAARTLPAVRDACLALWPRLVAPIVAGTHGPREFSKLFVAVRVWVQDDAVLDPGIVAAAGAAPAAPPPSAATVTDLAALLPTTARLLLLAAYLASHNATRHDLTLFSTHHHGRRRRRGGALAVPGTPGRRGGAGRSKHRKIARKLLGAHAFVLERMMAIYAAVRSEWTESFRGEEEDGGADVGMAMATLASLRLLVRVGGGSGSQGTAGGGGDPMDRAGKWRVNVAWEVVRGLGRSMGVEVEEWLVE
ncbi:origin recognition complex subunit 5 C-terminus-domain-containing protein [Echria macrotheca]|uniref:Origin recognition complex subunit 5 C-terminus-domain-containing protein n=1 Tax=Echria macrotheca TaxID=438768 RepID=A0AAJ0FBK1_9PEZI|nr:origin recognition complex subunit 5 C-terminus-domain-containing protein [Echria macrotheca]